MAGNQFQIQGAKDQEKENRKHRAGDVANKQAELEAAGIPTPPGGLRPEHFEPGNTQGNEEYYKWLSTQSPETLDALDSAGVVGISATRELYTRYGVRMPGVGMNGEGLTDDYGNPLDKRELATATAGFQAHQSEKLEEDIANQEVAPLEMAQDQGPGYRLEDTLQYLDDADPLKLALQEQVINQSRTDDTGLQAQQDALAGYRDIYGQGGLTAIDRAAMAKSNNIGRMRGRAAEQGRAGGNLEFLSRAGAQQSATQLIADQDLQTQAMALARKDAALGGLSATGGAVQTAQDAIDHFNTEGERVRARENIDRENEGATATWGENQSREHANQVFHNAGATASFGGDTLRSAANTDRTNTGRMADSAGARALIGQRLAARGLTGQQAAGGAGMQYQFGQDQAQAEAAHDAAQGQLLGDLFGAAGEAVGTIYGGPVGAKVGKTVGKTAGGAA